MGGGWSGWGERLLVQVGVWFRCGGVPEDQAGGEGSDSGVWEARGGEKAKGANVGMGGCKWAKAQKLGGKINEIF